MTYCFSRSYLGHESGDPGIIANLRTLTQIHANEITQVALSPMWGNLGQYISDCVLFGKILMKQEFHSPDDASGTPDCGRAAAISVAANQSPDALAAFWEELEVELDAENPEEQQIAKSPTLTIERDAQVTIEPPPGMPDAKPRYVQGVVVDEQVCLVTNLLKPESITLRQPQLVWTIGRNRSAALPLQDRKLSRRHAIILYQKDRFHFIDLNSMNGSYINGVRVQQRQPLQDGDCICVGSTRFFFFASVQERVAEAIHPEVLARLNNLAARTGAFIDFSELNEEISFNLSRAD